jgi:uncharacterized surface protein with fasciclin (FAS1) repeats
LVFAPTNAALAATLDSLNISIFNPSPADATVLRDIILYHVAPSK